jgi:hypothetical protein
VHVAIDAVTVAAYIALKINIGKRESQIFWQFPSRWEHSNLSSNERPFLRYGKAMLTLSEVVLIK